MINFNTGRHKPIIYKFNDLAKWMVKSADKKIKKPKKNTSSTTLPSNFYYHEITHVIW
jgi:hypothetical protein